MRLLDNIMASCELPRHFPMAGVAREHFAPGLRVTFAGNYAIYYLHNSSELVIVRVLHRARDAAAMADNGAFQDK